jgi:hypothetical protein
MTVNARVGGLQVLVDAAADTQARVGGLQVLVDAAADANVQVGGIMVLVDAVFAVVTGLTPAYRLRHGKGFAAEVLLAYGSEA